MRVTMVIRFQEFFICKHASKSAQAVPLLYKYPDGSAVINTGHVGSGTFQGTEEVS